MKDCFSKGGNRRGKILKKYSMKDIMSIKISFMHYMKWTRVIIPAFFEEFEFFFLATFFFSISLSIRKRSKIYKNLKVDKI